MTSSLFEKLTVQSIFNIFGNRNREGMPYLPMVLQTLGEWLYFYQKTYSTIALKIS